MARNFIIYYFGILFVQFGIIYGWGQSKSEPVVIEEGGSLLWKCDIRTNSTSDAGRNSNLLWKRNNLWVNRTWVLPNGSLHLLAVRRGVHEGVFRCCRQQASICGEEKVLLVANSCSVVLRPSDVVLREGDRHTWQCEAHCSESGALIGWRRDGRLPIEQTLPDGTLNLQSLASNDAGVYRCCATNSAGTFCSTGAKLIIISDLPLLTIQPQRRITVGSAARLQCSQPSGPQLDADYHWLFNGARFPPDDVSGSQRVILLPQGIIHFTRLLYSDAGLYQCSCDQGGSRAGNATLEVTDVTVLERRPWLILTGPVSQDRKVGKSALMECLTQGENLIIAWTQDDGALLSQGGRLLGGSNLFFERLTLEDSGNYICSVTDPATGQSVHASATLRVLAPPVIHPPLPATQKVKLGHVFKINCSGTGTPEYIWLFNGAPVIPDRRHLVSSDVLRVLYSTSADAGVYQCIVKNAGGKDVSSTEIRFLAGAPDPPHSVSITDVTSTLFRVSWQRPKDVMAWTVRYYPMPDGEEESVVIITDSREITKGVTPFTEYAVVVLAFNSKSGSDPSDTIYVRTAPDAPLGSPEFFLSTTTNGSVQVSPLPMLRESRQGLITHYLVQYKTAGSRQTHLRQIPANSSDDVITDPRSGETYLFGVAAVNVVGAGPYSARKAITVARTEELEGPTPLVEIWNGTSVSVVWEQIPANTTIGGHRMVVTNLHNETIGNMRTIPAPKTDATIGDLEPDTYYEIHIAAYNEYGDGPRSVLEFTTPPLDPTLEPTCPVLPPFGVSSSYVTSTGLVISWSEPITSLDYDKIVVQYEPTSQVQGKPKGLVTVNASVFDQQITGLQPYTTYSFRVSVGCRGGFGPLSQMYLYTTSQDVPATPPESVDAHSVDQHTVDVEWEPPLKPNGVIVYYLVLYNKDNMTPEHYWRSHQSNGTSQRSVINNLDSGTRYFFKVKAATLVGDGPSTDPVPALTKPDETGVMSQKQIGVLLGVGLAFLCILLCCILIIFKYRSVDPHTHPGWRGYHPNGALPERQHRYAETQEGELVTMMPMLVPNTDRHVRVSGQTTFDNSGHYITAHYRDSTCSPKSASTSSSTLPKDRVTQGPTSRTTAPSVSEDPPPTPDTGGPTRDIHLHLDRSGSGEPPQGGNQPAETTSLLPSSMLSSPMWDGHKHLNGAKETAV